jgi:hypothetical protein
VILHVADTAGPQGRLFAASHDSVDFRHASERDQGPNLLGEERAIGRVVLLAEFGHLELLLVLLELVVDGGAETQGPRRLRAALGAYFGDQDPREYLDRRTTVRADPSQSLGPTPGNA